MGHRDRGDGSETDLRVVLLEPGETQDHALFAKSGDCEEYTFRMSFVGHDHVYDPVYASGLVRSTIHIVDRDRLRQFAGQEFSLFYKVSVDEISAGASVYHSFGRCFF